MLNFPHSYYLFVLYVFCLTVKMYKSDLEYVDLATEASDEASINDHIKTLLEKDKTPKLVCSNTSNFTEDNVFIWAYMEKFYDTNQDSFVDENEIKDNLAILIK